MFTVGHSWTGSAPLLQVDADLQGFRQDATAVLLAEAGKPAALDGVVARCAFSCCPGCSSYPAAVSLQLLTLPHASVGGRDALTRILSCLTELDCQLALHALYHESHHLLPGCLHIKVASTVQLTITCAALYSVLHVVGKCLEDDVSMFRYNIQDIVDDLEVRLLSNRPYPQAWCPSSMPSEMCWRNVLTCC